MGLEKWHLRVFDVAAEDGVQFPGSKEVSTQPPVSPSPRGPNKHPLLASEGTHTYRHTCTHRQIHTYNF